MNPPIPYPSPKCPTNPVPITAFLFALLTSLLLTDGVAQDNPAEATGKVPFATPKAEPEDKVRDAVQVTELGLMRTLVVFDEDIDDSLVRIVNQRLSDVHFRVFESAVRTKPGATADELKALGTKHHADLVLHAAVTAREKQALGEAKLYEAEATVQFLSPVNGELLITQTGRADGVRKFDEVEAKRSATEKVLDSVVQEAAVKALEKSNKIIVYEVTLSGVANATHLLAIKDHIAKLQGVYHVRELSYEAKSRISTLEVMGSPKMLTFLKAHLETLPKSSSR